MEDKEYFSLPQISNSDIGDFYREMQGVERREGLEEVFRFGTLVHQLVLEPHKAEKNHPNMEQAKAMAEKVKEDFLAKTLFAHPEFSPEKVFRRELQGVPCRTKIDGAVDSKKIGFELKTTSAVNQKAFEFMLKSYDYDRQFAIELDVTEFDTLIVFAVSKTLKNPKVFKWVVTRESDWYIVGKEKYIEALNLIKEAQWKPQRQR